VTHPLHKHLCEQLGKRLATRTVVVFYDPREELAAFIDGELEEVGRRAGKLLRVALGEQLPMLARFEGSYFGLRTEVEPIAQADVPDSLILYLPGVERDRDSSVLMELEKGGSVYEPQLKRLARNALREFYTDGDIDDMLAPEALSYGDVVGYLKQAIEGEQASILRTIFEATSSEGLIAQWLADETQDTVIVDRAMSELGKLIEARLGLSLPAETAISDARARTVRYVLINEFRSDLGGDSPSSLEMVPSPPSKEHSDRIVGVAEDLRKHNGDHYPELADRVETDFNLTSVDLDPSLLGRTDTFRFEEGRLLAHVIEQIADQQFDEAIELVASRARSFWLDRNVGRQAQWEACRLAAELGRELKRVDVALAEAGEGPEAWVSEYTANGGWLEVDRLQRRLETWLTQMDEEPGAAQAIAVIRQECDQVLTSMATGFATALAAADWAIPGVRPQTSIYPDLVETAGGRVAYFLVDAMRFEMGVELADQLEQARELSVDSTVAMLPTVTPIGMAALLPAASASFSVVEHGGKLAALVDATPLTNLSERMKFLKARVPDVVDLSLGDVLQTSESKLRSTIDGAQLVLVRSQEIDAVGELDTDLVRQVMETVIGNIARAVRKLASAGVESYVVAADHGHQFSRRKEEDMRTDNPGGDAVALHRRCWVGRGGITPQGTVRVSGAELGYETDLDFVFPTGLGVFKAGGGLSYHHGGISLQELVIPVISFRMPTAEAEPAVGSGIYLGDVPAAVTNRVFSVRLQVVGDVLSTEPIPLRVVLVHAGEQVGQAGMAVDADLDRDTGTATVKPGSEASLGLMLTREDCPSLRVVVQDPATDAVLAQSDEIPVQLGI